jgi:glycosyltransferase involved in cell wall biosynthesis
MAPPLVSVVIPSFNRAHCIERTIDSVLGQTHPEVELLVIDDGSTDGTGDLLRGRYAGECRLRYVYQENQGVCAARNRGLDDAGGEFIALLDSDDIWKPWKLELQLACMIRAPHIGMIWSDMDAIDPNGRVSSPKYLRTMYSAYRWFRPEDLFTDSCDLAEISPTLAHAAGGGRFFTGDIFSQMVMGNLVHTSTVLIRRERLARVRHFNLELRRSGEDYDFHLRTCREGPVGFIDCASILYMYGAEDQLTAAKYGIDRAQNFLKTIEPVLQHERTRIKLPPWMIADVLAEAHRWIGLEQLSLDQPRLARRHLIRSLRYQPKQPRLAAWLALSLLPEGAREGVRRAYRRVRRLRRR